MLEDKDDIFGDAISAGEFERQEEADLPSYAMAMRLLELSLESLNAAGNPVMRPVSYLPGNVAAGFTILVPDVGFVRWLGGTRFQVMSSRPEPFHVSYDLTDRIHGGDMRRFLSAMAADPIGFCAGVAADLPTFSFLSPYSAGDPMKARSFLVTATGLVAGILAHRDLIAPEAIETTIAEANGGNAEHSFTSADLIRVAAIGEDRIENIGLAEDDRHGIVIVAASATRRIGEGPYDRPSIGTVARLQRREDGWHLVELERKELPAGRAEVVFMPFSRAPMAAFQRESTK